MVTPSDRSGLVSNTFTRKLDRRPTLAEQQAIGKELWAEVDAELEAFETFVADQLSGPVSRRNPHTFNFTVGQAIP